jgi:heme-degrading monooxygenase HmoA
MLYSFTHFKVRAWWLVPLFQWHGMLSTFQYKKAKGLVDVNIWNEERRVFYVLSCWQTKEDMLVYRNRGAHLRAIKASHKLGQAQVVSFVSYAQPTLEYCKSLLRNPPSTLNQLIC